MTDLVAGGTGWQDRAKSLDAPDGEMYRALFESSHEARLLFDVDGAVVDANQRLTDITSYSRDELVGRSSFSLARLLTRKGLALLVSNPMSGNSCGRKIVVFGKNGDPVAVEIESQALRIGPRVVGRLMTLRQAVASRQHEEPDESEDRYKRLAGDLGIGVFRTTPGVDGAFLDVNAAMEKITGFSRRELLEMPVSSLYVHREQRALVVMRAISGRSLSPVELRLRRKDGSEMVARDRKIAVEADDGASIYLEGFLEDVTETTRAEELLVLRDRH